MSMNHKCSLENILLDSFSSSCNSASSSPKNVSGTAWIPLLLLTAPVERNLRHVVVEKDLFRAELNGVEVCMRIARDASSSLCMGGRREKFCVNPETQQVGYNIQKRKLFTFTPTTTQLRGCLITSGVRCFEYRQSLPPYRLNHNSSFSRDLRQCTICCLGV